MSNCSYRTAEVYGGDFLEVDGFAVWADSPPAPGRRKKYRPTSEAQELYNAKVAQRKLTRLIHANFTEDDYSVTLTYDDYHLPADDEEIKRHARNFLARLRRLYGRFGIICKYILVSARGKRGGRAHHHLIVSGGVPSESIKALWSFGRRRCENLQFDMDGVAALADYILEQAEVWSKRWCCSRNLVRPEPDVRDDRITARDAYTLADRSTSPARLYELTAKLWPGYQLSSVQSQNLNEINGGAYFTLRLIRTGSKYAAPNYEYWSTAWLKRAKRADDRDSIRVRDGRSVHKRTRNRGQSKIPGGDNGEQDN